MQGVGFNNSDTFFMTKTLYHIGFYQLYTQFLKTWIEHLTFWIEYLYFWNDHQYNWIEYLTI